MKETQPDNPNKGVETSADDDINAENLQVVPWYEKLHDIFIDKPEIDEEVEDEAQPSSKKGRFGRMLAKVFGSIARKEDIDGEPPETSRIEPLGSELPIVEEQIEIEHSPEALEENYDLEGQYWPEDETESIEHRFDELADTQEKAATTDEPDSEGTLLVSHEESQWRDFAETTEETPAQNNNIKEIAPDDAPSSRKNRAAIYESRSYLDYRIAQEARKLDWETHRAERLLREEVRKAKSEIERHIDNKAKPDLASQKPDSKIAPEYEVEKQEKHVYPKTVEQSVQYIETVDKKHPPVETSEIHNVTTPVEKVIERVAEAAKRGEAIEKSYELRHEVKDEDTANTAVSVGAIMAEAVKGLSKRDQAPQLSSAESLRKFASIQSEVQPTLYKTAVKNGLYTGLMIIIFAAIAYLVTS